MNLLTLLKELRKWHSSLSLQYLNCFFNKLVLRHWSWYTCVERLFYTYGIWEVAKDSGRIMKWKL